MTNRQIFYAYIKDHRGVMILFLVIFCIMAFLFYLYQYALLAVLYAFLLSAAFMAVVGAYNFSRYRKRCLYLRQIQGNLDALKALPVSGAYPEQLLNETVQAVLVKLQELEIANMRKQSETDAYYTMWVHQVKIPIAGMQLTLQSDKTQESRILRQELFKIEQYADMALGYSRIESMSADLQLETVDMHALLADCIKKFAATFIYQRLNVTLEDFDNRVVSDKKWLKFVIEQLLSNALKYTKQGGIEIKMDNADKLYIRDSGIGIAPEDLPRIFERGFTGQNGRLDQRATGLGLFLADKVMHKLDHKLEIRSELGVGTICILYLHREPLQGE